MPGLQELLPRWFLRRCTGIFLPPQERAVPMSLGSRTLPCAGSGWRFRALCSRPFARDRLRWLCLDLKPICSLFKFGRSYRKAGSLRSPRAHLRWLSLHRAPCQQSNPKAASWGGEQTAEKMCHLLVKPGKGTTVKFLPCFSCPVHQESRAWHAPSLRLSIRGTASQRPPAK